jgi:uncharacterized membrane protein YecN with MAPEG domain
MQVVQLYAAVLGLVFIALSVRTLRLRRSLRVAVGDGGNIVMLRAMRAHANFAEYVPFSVVLLFMVQTQGAPGWLLHVLGLALLLGRLSHAYGVSHEPENFRFRVFGMMMTFGVLAVSCARLLATSVGLSLF